MSFVKRPGGDPTQMAGGLREPELPIFEEKAITSRVAEKAVSAFQAKGGAAFEELASRAGAAGLGGGGGALGGTDLTFAWENAAGPQGPWSHLRVVSVRGTEALSSLYRYEITALAREPAPELDPDELIQARATLRIATTTLPSFRVVHGIVVEAEELGPVPGGMLYRLVLAPPLTRAMHRMRCRIFLEKTTRQIIDAVLQGDPELTLAVGANAQPDGGDDLSFSPAMERYTWRIADASRIDEVATRGYCVQYNESDFAFVCRLLEEEGISFHYENGDGVCLLVLSDNDAGRTRLDPFEPLGPGIVGRAVQSMKLGARMRPRKVSLLDYNWKQPTLDMAVAEPARPASADLVYHEYPGRYTETPAMGKPLAAATLDRLEVEASYAVGESSCRTIAAGSIFALEHPQSRYEGEYLVTKIEVRAEQAGVLPPSVATAMPLSGVPYVVTFECARRGKNGSVAESRFRPARVTPKPRIHGSQTAFVTAEPSTKGAEIHVGGPPGAEIGCVRLKFHWDTDTARHAKEPTSCWVRVNQVFAGVGEGAVFHPRVGVEAIVDFEEGDPDRPIIVGRVYNGKNRPPGGAPTVSTFKTMSSPSSGAFNELTFDDTAGNEQIKMHTPFNWNSDAGNDRTEKVGNNSASTAGVDRNEMTGSNRTTMAGGNNAEVVGGNESVTVGANQNMNVGANQSVSVGANRSVDVGANQSVTVAGNHTETVTGNRESTISSNDKLTVTGTQDVHVTGAQTENYGATQDITVAGNQKAQIGGEQTIEVTGPQGLKSGASQKIEAPAQEIKADGTQALKSTVLTVNAAAMATVETTMLTLNGAAFTQINTASLVITAGTITINGGAISINGGTVSVKGSPVDIDGGGAVNVTAGLIKLN
ncbi:type VI secretion system tip protein TssI/VgrG [Polyangium sp. y55x31]|uniref:type VI secretion system Vgr family protein n=1 Tax=Polyangium sp. y55x31 TaxID=3042688 RepID=UPI0024823D8F|nr:type VI secretion system tip protein TssI/VgrG [Polyangium sp. y55x31]MDI1484118.1 type VI secretion system tip protein TssI/VgrG [Polyangium sp. y55x31]